MDVMEAAENFKLPTEVEVIQYLRPNGKKRKMYASVGKKVAKMAEDMILEAEDLGTGMVAIWVRWKDESEEEQALDLATNGPGESDPSIVLANLITKKWYERHPNG